MSSNVFGRGYKAVRQEKQRQEVEKEKRNALLWRFFLSKDGDEADISFLTEDPITFDEHTHQSNINGKQRYTQSTCTISEPNGCEDCDNGDRPSFKGAYLIVDHREFEYKDKDGNKKKAKDKLKLFVFGTRVLSQLDRISERYGLSNRVMTIVKLGSGTQTTYTFERGNERKLTRKEIEAYLGDTFIKKYDGTMESLYKIVEEQVSLNARSIDPEGINTELDEDEEKVARSSLVSIYDEDKKSSEPPKVRVTKLLRKK